MKYRQRTTQRVHNVGRRHPALSFQLLGLLGNFYQCSQRRVPIAVLKATDDELVFVVNRSKVISSCVDATYALNKVDFDKIEGFTHREDVKQDTQ